MIYNDINDFKEGLHDPFSFWMDCNGKLWYFKDFADKALKQDCRMPLFSKQNVYKIESRLRAICMRRKNV